MNTNNIKGAHIVMFIILMMPCWLFSFYMKYIENVILSPWFLLFIQSVPLIGWMVYTSNIPSVIGQARDKVSKLKKIPLDFINTGVGIRSTFVTVSVAGMTLAGLQIHESPISYNYYNYLSMIYFSLSFISFIVSSDITDTAKNIPFRNSKYGVSLTRRGARYYQYGLIFLILGFICTITNIGYWFTYLVIIFWNILYLYANIPIKQLNINLINWEIIILFYLISILPTVLISASLTEDAILYLLYVIIFILIIIFR